MSKTKKVTHILVERRPTPPNPKNPEKIPVTKQRTVGPLHFDFSGPGPWEIQEDHLRLVEDIVQSKSKKKPPPPPPPPPADTAGAGDNQAAGAGAKPEEKKESTGDTGTGTKRR